MDSDLYGYIEATPHGRITFTYLDNILVFAAVSITLGGTNKQC